MIKSTDPHFFSCEHHDRGPPRDEAMEQLIDHRAARFALHARPWIAIQNIFANVEIEGGKFHIHKIRESSGSFFIIVNIVSRLHSFAQFVQQVQNVTFKLWHVFGVCGFPIFQAFECAQHIAKRVAQFAIIFDGRFQNLRPNAHVIGIITGGHPEAQNICAGVFDHVLRNRGVAQGL